MTHYFIDASANSLVNYKSNEYHPYKINENIQLNKSFTSYAFVKIIKGDIKLIKTGLLKVNDSMYGETYSAYSTLIDVKNNIHNINGGIKIYYDCQFIYEVLLNNQISFSTKPKYFNGLINEYKNLYNHLIKLGLNIKFIKVKSHCAKDPYHHNNNIVDKIAKSAIFKLYNNPNEYEFNSLDEYKLFNLNGGY